MNDKQNEEQENEKKQNEGLGLLGVLLSLFIGYKAGKKAGKWLTSDTK